MAIINWQHGPQHSPNLAKWLRRERRRASFANFEVWRSKEDGGLWIGWFDELDWFVGSRLNRVLCVGLKAEVGCWTDIKRGEMVKAEGFWDRYAIIGRCAIDVDHRQYFIGDETRWQVDGDHRSCLWCGNHEQQLHRWTEAVERKAWRPAKAIEAGTAGTLGPVHESADPTGVCPEDVS